MGDDSGEIHSSPAGRESQLNARNYRIRAEDRLGDGSLKQKCRDNFAAIELVRLLDSQNRAVGVLSLGDLAIERDSKSVLGQISAAPPSQ